MENLQEVLRQQLKICRQIEQLAEAQKEKFTVSSIPRTDDFVKEMEKLLAELGRLENIKEQYLHQQNVVNVEDFISRSADSDAKNLTAKLQAALLQTMQKLQRLGRENKDMLDRTMKYINFSVNVLTQTAAGGTYAASGGEQGMTSKKKMFDQSV